MNKILDLAKKYQQDMVDHRRYLHMNAEIGHDLPLTTAFVIGKLKEMGYKPEVICEGGIVAIADGGKEGKTILLRGDMDALPLQEEVECEFKSITGNMHACGHDLHTAMLLGAAKILKECESELCGKVKLMFQPAEEISTGAKAMVDAGVLEEPKVDAAIMIHVISGMEIENGTVIFMSKGATSASADIFKINVTGKGGHGAMPNIAIDPLNILAHIHVALGEINSREIQPGETGVVTIGEIHGGNAPNIIPNAAYMSGTIRTFNKDVREFIKNRLIEISTGTATTFRGEAEVKFSQSCPSVINDEELYDRTIRYSRELLGENKVCDSEKVLGKISASEDFGYISEKVPTLMMTLAASGKGEDGEAYPQHHPKVRFDESTMYIGASVYANTAIQWLKETSGQGE